MFSLTQATAWVERSVTVVDDHADELTRLDQAIGDGDHGINMRRGFKAVHEKLAQLDAPDFSALFKGVGMTLVGKVGGASGPLYGSLYLGIGRQLGAVDEVDDAGLAAGLRAGLEAVQARGKAEPGDKTMIDAWQPALAALDGAIAEGSTLGAALDATADAAEAAAMATIPLVARKGRASYLGERSRDHEDPGAASSALLLGALADVVNER